MEHYLEVCVNFLTFWDPQNSGLPSRSSLAQPMLDIFHAYTQSKLSAPRGWRTMPTQDEEVIDLEEDDRVVFAEELSSMGCIARAISSHSLPLLTSLLSQCLGECLELLVLVRGDPSALGSAQQRLEAAYEDLHWLTLVSAHTLCDVEQGEVVQIPREIMDFSISSHHERVGQGKEGGEREGLVCAEAQGVDFERNVAALVLEGERGGAVDLTGLDPVVALVLSVCRISLLERQFISCGLIDLLSPQLCETGAWSLSRIVGPYVMFSDENYGQVSLPMVAAFGKESKSARWLTAFLLEKVAFNLSMWASEETVCSTSILLLQTLVKSQPRYEQLSSDCHMTWSRWYSLSGDCHGTFHVTFT